MVQRSAGDTDAALGLATEAAGLLEPRLDDGTDDQAGLAGALELHAAATCARAGREGDAWRHWDKAAAIAGRLPAGYHHPWTMFGTANVALHAVSLNADLSRSAEARAQAEQIDPDTIPSRERRGRLGVEIARSYHQRRDYPAMLHWLERAYATSADSVCYSPTARQMAAEAVDHGGPLIQRRSHALAASLAQTRLLLLRAGVSRQVPGDTGGVIAAVPSAATEPCGLPGARAGCGSAGRAAPKWLAQRPAPGAARPAPRGALGRRAGW